MSSPHASTEAPPTPPGPPARVSARLRAIAALVAVFVLGVATGGAGMRFAVARAIHRVHAMPPAEARKHLVLRALEGRLSLTADQRSRIEAILDGHASELQAIARHAEPEVAPILERMEEEIRGTLRPDQRSGYDDLVAVYNARRRRGLAEIPSPLP